MQPDLDQTLAALGEQDVWLQQKTPYPQVAKGGSWDDDPNKLRSAARRFSAKSWKMQDPQLPKSIWYLTDAQFLGFRLVRPLKVPPPEEARRFADLAKRFGLPEAAFGWAGGQTLTASYRDSPTRAALPT